MQSNSRKVLEQNKTPTINRIASDYWKPYENIMPKEKHLQTKAKIFTAEGYNSLFRHFLASRNEKKDCLGINYFTRNIPFFDSVRQGLSTAQILNAFALP
ncbi:hypothetical protein Barb4_04652 [Bacteroidales bacterium Barb4]|nr:hypothetical protein Barb4_04652 [Bacteroidales bacterium Barb4]